MPYVPTIHHRRSIRLKGYDYSSQGAYFVTLCCEDRKHRFGEITQHQMHLNDLGKIAAEWMENLPTKFPNIEIGEYIIMPDHIHAIIVINDAIPERVDRDGDTEEISRGDREVREVRAPFTGALEEGAPDASLGNIVGAYKSLVANGCLKWYKERNLRMGKLWQRNYFERIIRDERAYENIAAYIRNNPEKWPDESPEVRAPFTGDLEEAPDAIDRGDRKGRPDESRPDRNKKE
ncbi:MAG: transposase [Bacteroidales bacterium]|nr:transposase [Bacteroidales bacterium]